MKIARLGIIIALLCMILSAPMPAHAARISVTGSSISVTGSTSVTERISGTSPISVTSSSASEHQRTLLILSDSLEWGYISAETTPHLARWAASGTMFNMVPPNINGWDCPQDIALSLSAGGAILPYTTASSPACQTHRLDAGKMMQSWLRIMADNIATHVRVRLSKEPDTQQMLRDAGFRNEAGDFALSDRELNDAALRAARVIVTDMPSSSPDESLNAFVEKCATEALENGDLLPMGEFGQLLAEHGVDFSAIGTSAGILTAQKNGTVPASWRNAEKNADDLAAQVSQELTRHQMVVVDASNTNFAADSARADAIRKKNYSLPPFLRPDPNSEPGNDVDSTDPRAIFLNGYREDQGQSNAARIDALLAQVPSDTFVMMLSLQGMSATAHLQPGFVAFAGDGGDGAGVSSGDGAAVAEGEGGGDGAEAGADGAGQARLGKGGLGWSSQVRQMGNVSYLSLIPLLLERLGIEDTREAYMPSMTIASGSDDSMTFAQRADLLESSAAKAAAIRSSRAPFYGVMRTAAISFMLVSTIYLMWRLPVLVRGKRVERHQSKFGGRLPVRVRGKAQRILAALHTFDSRPWMRAIMAAARIVLIIGGLWISAVPLSSHLVTAFVPWWFSYTPTYVLVTSTWGCALAIALLTSQLLRIHKFLPVTAIAAATAAVLLFDVATGSRVLADSPMGFNTLMGARFYGMGNEAFALVGVGAFLGIAGISALLIRAKLPRWLVGMIAALLGLGVALIDVWPSMGADFGGALAFIPALMVFLVLLSNVRISLRMCAVAFLLAAGAAVGAAALDWLRPEGQRTHLGNFVQSILDGEAIDIIWRKLSVNLRLLQTSPHRWIVLIGLIFIVCVFVPLLARWYESVRGSLLLIGLVSVGVCLLLGFALNDSGIALPGMGFILLLPGLIAGCAMEQSLVMPDELRRAE